MSQNSDNIEERLIPFIEGVLNEREQREVEEALKADADLAREVSELREVIGDLRGAFASGVSPDGDELSVEEVIELASHDGGLDSMKGTADQKARLFCNDQALEEYRLLRSLTEDMQQTTLPMVEVPPMPESLLAEIGRYQAAKSPKVVELAPKLSLDKPTKPGFLGFLDRFDPKPLMATAAAFVLLSLGFHIYNTPSQSPTMSGDQVSYSYKDASATPSVTPISEVATVNGKTTVEPTGVTVFTSGDRELLKEQAEKLLANKVRYTVTEDRILVAEKEIAQARAVLWGEEEAAQVAAAEKQKEGKLKTKGRPSFSIDEPDEAPKAKRPVAAPAVVAEEAEEEFVPPPITRYDYRSGRKKASTDPEVVSPSDDERADGDDFRDESLRGEGGQNETDLGERSALQPKSPSPASEPKWSSKSEGGETEKPVPTGGISTGASSTSAAAGLKGASKEERERILKAMALGQTDENEAAPVSTVAKSSSYQPKPKARAKKSKAAPSKDAPMETRISRARRSNGVVENRSTAVANVITADGYPSQDKNREAEFEQDSGGSVAVTGEGQRVQQQRLEVQAPAPPPEPSKQDAGYLPGGASVNDQSVAGVASSGGDVDLRMAMVLDSQAAVARRHNVVLSVESVGGAIRVYVRPNEDLSKAELDALRAALRAELGLSSGDSIVFR